MLITKYINSFEDLEALSEKWDTLLQQSINYTYSLSWNWVFNWVRIYIEEQNKLLCIAVYDKNDLVGIAPFWIEQKQQLLFKPIRILRFIGSKEICPDHLDLIIHKKNSKEICAEIWEHLFNNLHKKWDIWEYNSVSVHSPILQILRKLSDNDRRNLGFSINNYEVCPYIQLPESWNIYLESLSANQRRALKISGDRISKLGTITLKFCETIQELPEFMETHINLHKKSWADRGKTGSFRTEQFRRFHNEFARDCLNNGSLFLCNLELDNIPIGSFYGFVYNKTLLYYLIGVNRSAVPTANIGRVLLGYCIKEAIRRGYNGFDFLRGSESYKYDWTNLEQQELFVTFYNRSFRALVFILKQFLSSFCRQYGYVLLGEKVKNLKRLYDGIFKRKLFFK